MRIAPFFALDTTDFAISRPSNEINGSTEALFSRSDDPDCCHATNFAVPLQSVGWEGSAVG